MPLNAIVEVKEGELSGTIRGFLKSLLEKELVDALLVPMEVPSKKNVVQTMVKDIGGLDKADPLAPVMPVNSAKIVSSLTKLAPSKKKIGLVMRSCELRALTELVKLKQADVANLVLIGVDCFGTYSVSDYGVFCRENDSPTEVYLKRAKDGNDPLLRQSCRICQHPAPLSADITIGLIGMDLGKEIMLQANSETGQEMLKALKLGDRAESSKRDAAVSALSAEKNKQRDAFVKQAQQEVGGLENMLSEIAACVACHNCRIACPICYCRECLLDSPTFGEWEAEKYLEWADKKGALRMPADSLLFHLVRLNHMGASCVACGLCEDACPNGISVFKLFCLAGSKVQQAFDYLPGRSLEDELPLIAFKEEEFREFEK
jgi:formate dehydrogenase subunit beta